MSQLKPPQKNAFWIDLLKILLPLLVCGLLAVHANPAGFTLALQQVFAVAGSQEDAALSRALKDVLVFQPWRVELLEQLGAVQIRQGDPAAAVQTYRQAELHGDLSLGGQLAYTGALAETGQTEAASEALNQAALRSGLNAAQRDQILQARRKMRDLSGAVNDLQRWASENHGDMTLLYRLAAYTAVSQPKDAILLMPPTSDLPQELQKEAAGLRSALAELPGEAPPVQHWQRWGSICPGGRLAAGGICFFQCGTVQIRNMRSMGFFGAPHWITPAAKAWPARLSGRFP